MGAWASAEGQYERDHSPGPRPVQQGSRRSGSIAPPQAGRGTDCPRQGLPYKREGSSPEDETPNPAHGISGRLGERKRIEPGPKGAADGVLFCMQYLDREHALYFNVD